MQVVRLVVQEAEALPRQSIALVEKDKNFDNNISTGVIEIIYFVGHFELPYVTLNIKPGLTGSALGRSPRRKG